MIELCISITTRSIDLVLGIGVRWYALLVEMDGSFDRVPGRIRSNCRRAD